MTHYSVLYFLDHDQYAFVEIKRTDLPDKTDKSKLFFWLMFDKAKGSLQKLEFVSMLSDEQGEKRLFRQGQLTFGAVDGKFTGNDSFEVKLKRKTTDNLPFSMVQAFNAFFK
jgi:hypothetical protein